MEQWTEGSRQVRGREVEFGPHGAEGPHRGSPMLVLLQGLHWGEPGCLGVQGLSTPPGGPAGLGWGHILQVRRGC